LTKPNKVFHREGGDKYLSTTPPLGMGAYPPIGGPLPPYPPLCRSKCQFWGG